mmetsp:Transcript_56421/g.125935  ORF Transcript_56421/g.125935 Transcript_56421/m.125935 type:complete len:321 (-) Transcript_56421:591-1553(-)
MSDVPVSLKAIKPYIERWQEIKPRDPIVAYHCRLFALQQAMEKRAEIPKEDMKYILSLMDALEAEKATLGDLEDAGVQVENFGQELFQKADDNDRAGQSDLRTAKAFLAAGHVMESCKQFGELPADLQEKIKYAKWRFVEIAKAVKERRTPAPPRGTEPTTPADDDSAGPSAGIPPADPMPPPPSFQDMPAPPAAVDYPPASYPPSDYPPYMGLPPATPSAVPEAPQAGFPSAPPAHVPPTFGGYAAPPGGGLAPPAVSSVPSPVMMPPGFKPAKPAVLEAMALCKSAMNALQFQDAETAVHSLTTAIHLLTHPPMPTPE